MRRERSAGGVLGLHGSLDSSPQIVARYQYDPFGRATKLHGSFDSDFGFTGHYFHQPSGLNLALHRAYDPDTGRWLSRDPIGEAGGANLYSYVGNNPVTIGRRICVVGSRAKGTAKPASDWDYVIEGISRRDYNKIKNSLPGAPSPLDGVPRRMDIDRGPLRPKEPFVPFNPRK